MKDRFFCAFTKDELYLIIYALQDTAQTSLDIATISKNNIEADIEKAHAQKLQALAAVINTAVENPNEVIWPSD